MRVTITHKATGHSTIHKHVAQIVETDDRFELIDQPHSRGIRTSTSYHKSLFSFAMPHQSMEEADAPPAAGDNPRPIWPDIKGYTRTPQDDGTVCYFIGNITIRVKEELCGEGLHLAPVAGDQVACGQWVDLDQEELAGYCGLLERRIQADMQGLDTTMEPMEEDEQEL